MSCGMRDRTGEAGSAAADVAMVDEDRTPS